MTKKITITVVSVLLAILMILSSCYACLYVWGTQKAANVTLTNGPSAQSSLKPTLIEEKVTSEGIVIAPSTENIYETYGNVKAYSKDGFLTSYELGNDFISFNTFAASGITDNIYYNGKNVATKYYENGDMNPDVLLLGNNVISVMYNGTIPETVTVNDGYIKAEHSTAENTTNMYFGNNLEHSYSFDQNKAVVKEADRNGQTVNYNYSNGYLDSTPSASSFTVKSNSIKYLCANATYEYTFDYEYKGERYLTRIDKNGITQASYSYINDAVVEARYNDGTIVNYILDSDLNHIGMICNSTIYYFVYDACGNIYCIIDENGNAVAFYETFAYNVSVRYRGGNAKNPVINAGTMIDSDSGALILPSEIIFVNDGVKVSLSSGVGKIASSDSLITYGTGEYYNRGGVSIETAIRGKIIEESMLYLENQGYATASNVSVVDMYENNVDFVDLYIVNSVCAGSSIKNVFAGDRIYSLVSEYDDYQLEKNKIAKYADENNSYFIDYFELYAPVVGDIIFEGQFVYYDYLVTYNATDEGTIVYRTYENKESLYNKYNNIYNYDDNTYAVFSDETFELELWDYTKIIPGLNQEQYDIIETYISDAMQICNETTFDDVRYLDQTYYDNYVNSAMGDTLDAFVDLSDTQMLELSSDGNIVVKAIPFLESTSVRKQFYRMIGTTAAATVVGGVISVAIPGSGAVVFAILKTAIWTGVKSIATSIAVSFVIDEVKENVLGIEINETLNEKMYRYYNSAIDAYYIGFITGALAGTLRYGKFYKATGDTLSSNISPSQRMQMKLNALDSRYSGGLLNDSMAARLEYDQMNMIIQTTDYSSAAIANNVIACTMKDSFIIKNTIKIFPKAASWERF